MIRSLKNRLLELLPRKCKLYKFFQFLLLFLIISCVIRIFASSSIDITQHKKIIIYTAVCTGLTFAIWDYEKKIFLAFFFYSILYTATAFIKIPVNLPLRGIEIVDAFCLGNLVCCLLLLLLRFIAMIKSLYFKVVSYLLLDIIIVIAMALPVFIIGYYIVSREILTATIILTLFQTNKQEAIDYLKDKDQLLWGISFLFAFIFIGGTLLFFNRIQKRFTNKPVTVFATLLFFVSALLIGFKHYPKLSHCYAVNIVKQTTQVLKEYKEYGMAKELRKHNLQQLKGITISPGQGGLYVLVIGESETRNHMHVYGYNKENTPWLTQMYNGGENGCLVFKNAYSNHTHTVPALTYALSTKNQYNQVNLKTAYSIVEVAKTAGYKIYWISNQLKYGIFDVPVAEIASASDHEIWINGSVGNTASTQFYDERIVKKVRELIHKKNENTFIICHLMGCHAFYPERYPSDYEKFLVLPKDSDKNILAYDNCVYYNDYVLKLLYEVVAQMPNFKGMIYLSDHGEDPDNKKGHEASKFTWQMTRIPLIMFFSKSFMQQSANTYRTLLRNKEQYWTNDLLYNVLVSILGIQNAPECTENLNISSDKYDMNRFNLKTLHGKKYLKEEMP